MKKLLSLPENLVKYFYEIKNVTKDEYFCLSDPKGHRVGSGGGTAWLINQCWKKDKTKEEYNSFDTWLNSEKRLIIHAGGQSRRVPAYAPLGKLLTPIPVFRWKRGQRIDQTLLDLELKTYEEILSKGNEKQNTLIASGDALIRTNESFSEIPDADIVCYGLWTDKELASSHGVFICPRSNPKQLKFMLQKPSLATLNEVLIDNMFLMDLGVWVLSDRAVKVLIQESGCYGDENAKPNFYDLYSQFGLGLGTDPSIKNEKINTLSVSVVPLSNGVFNHFGTSTELISSMLSIQNEVIDQREILDRVRTRHPSIFLQNMMMDFKFTAENKNLWIENSYLNKNWKLTRDNIITGIPENNLKIKLTKGLCIDIVPIEESKYCLRLYNIKDKFSGRWEDDETLYLGISFKVWLQQRGLNGNKLFSKFEKNDIQNLPIFPVVDNIYEIQELFNLITGQCSERELKSFGVKWENSKRLSAEDLTAKANLKRLFLQRRNLMIKNLKILKKNSYKSVFYQIDLEHIARLWVEGGLKLEPKEFDDKKTYFKEMQEWMFRSYVKKIEGLEYKQEEKNAFKLLQMSLLRPASSDKVLPKVSVFPDQVVWGRSPIRFEFAGGWTDTPPYCIINGGKVVNISLKLNGQDPLQVYVRKSNKNNITIRSIDLGTSEIIKTWEELENYNNIGNEFSITKAALCLCGFSQPFCSKNFKSLQEQLVFFSGGLEISTFAAIPKGSGLGTSSILAATIIAAISDFCGLNWDKKKVCKKVLVLEQMLTSGGGWQDQYGGAIFGVKLLESDQGLNQRIRVKWAPDKMFKAPEYKSRMLLYYTGITRIAKNILGNIVKSMFLNGKENLEILEEMKDHTIKTFDDIQRGDMESMCKDINRSWEMNQKLDKGTNPKPVKELISRINQYISCCKLCGAGGGGYLFIIAKDIESVSKIKKELETTPPNENARFVDIDISDEGLVVTRS